MLFASLISVLAPSCETKTDDNYSMDASLGRVGAIVGGSCLFTCL